MNEDRGCHDMFRRDSTYRDDFLDFGDSGGRGHSHEGIEVSRGQPIRQIAQLIGLLPFNESVVRVNGKFQDAALAFEESLFFPSAISVPTPTVV